MVNVFNYWYGKCTGSEYQFKIIVKIHGVLEGILYPKWAEMGLRSQKLMCVSILLSNDWKS